MLCQKGLVIIALSCIVYVLAAPSSSSSSPERYGRPRAELLATGESGVSPYIVNDAFIHDYNEYRYDPATWSGLTSTSAVDEEAMQVDESTIPSDLEGQDLIAYYDNTHQSNKIWTQHLLSMRRDLLQEATAIASEMTDVIWANDDPIHFIKFAGSQGLFDRYATVLESLRQEKPSAQSLCQTMQELKVKFEANKHLTGLSSNSNSGTLQAIKQGVMQYSRDVAELLDWTKPNSLAQIHELIFLHRNQDPERLIRQEVIKMQMIANHTS